MQRKYLLSCWRNTAAQCVGVCQRWPACRFQTLILSWRQNASISAALLNRPKSYTLNCQITTFWRKRVKEHQGKWASVTASPAKLQLFSSVSAMSSTVECSFGFPTQGSSLHSESLFSELIHSHCPQASHTKPEAQILLSDGECHSYMESSCVMEADCHYTQPNSKHLTCCALLTPLI